MTTHNKNPEQKLPEEHHYTKEQVAEILSQVAESTSTNIKLNPSDKSKECENG